MSLKITLNMFRKFTPENYNFIYRDRASILVHISPDQWC